MPTFMLDRLMKPRECEGADTADEEKEEVVEKDNDNVSADVYYLLTSLYMS